MAIIESDADDGLNTRVVTRFLPTAHVQDEGVDRTRMGKEGKERRLGPVRENGTAPKGCRCRDHRTNRRW